MLFAVVILPLTTVLPTPSSTMGCVLLPDSHETKKAFTDQSQLEGFGGFIKYWKKNLFVGHINFGAKLLE